jgi:hypothetical protein
LLFAEIFVFTHILVILLDVVVSDVSISEKILNLEGVKLFFVLNDLHWTYLSLFCDEGSWRSLLKDAYLRDHELDFSGQFIHEIEVMKE